MWTITKHAEIRISERGFDSDEILKVLREEVDSLVIRSPRDEDVDLYFSKIGSKYVLIVVNRTSHNIVTVRPMRMNEKRAYKEKMGN